MHREAITRYNGQAGWGCYGQLHDGTARYTNRNGLLHDLFDDTASTASLPAADVTPAVSHRHLLVPKTLATSVTSTLKKEAALSSSQWRA